MPEERELEKQLKVAAKTGKYIVGRREVQEGVKGSKLLVWSASANVPQKILDECKVLSVPAVRFDGNPVELGRACGIPFRVSVIALKSMGDADMRAFSNSSDYLSLSHAVVPGREEELAEKPKEEKPAKTTEKTTAKRKTRKKEKPEEEKEEAADSENGKSKKPARKRKSTKDKE
ncbi:MAG: ribosomal L7Ae/L30e/S12e/Gadd45 family protein [Nitrososphaerota archaeon]|nr:ribosomal L7Ae/L30e/S12e/Gadd45 family protein [Nitrososphaerota archaeon]